MISNVLQYTPVKQDDNNNIKSFQNLNESFKIPLKVSFGLGKYSVTPNVWQQKLLIIFPTSTHQSKIN